MRLISALAALMLFVMGVAASAESTTLDAFIERELPNSAAPGIAYAQVLDGKVTAKGFGEKTQGSGENVTAETLFPIGSVTKSFTALAVMQLVEQARLGLDDPISSHLPFFAEGPAAKVTLRQLLNHTSGYSTVQGNSHHGSDDASKIGLIEYAEQLSVVEPVHAPGSVWEYSNANYQILGAVIEQVSGESYADFIKANVFEPLGMSDSLVVVGPNPDQVATGHRPWFGRARAAAGGEGFPINAPGGGIVASARDMGLYLAMWLNNEDDLITASSKAAMLKPSGPASPLYGLGWSVDPEEGSAYHTGLVPGAETLASFNPSEGKGVVVMVNANGGLGFADTWYLIGGAGARALGQAHADDGSRTGPKIAYLSIALLPPLFVCFAAYSWRGRAQLRAKRETNAGKLSLWFPVLAMIGLAWFLIALLPQVFGGSIATLELYQPDFALCLIASAWLAPIWAAFRLILAYTTGQKPERPA